MWDAGEFVAKALENLSVAQAALVADASNAAASRAYYAAFHAGIAACLVHGRITPNQWKHDAVQAHVAEMATRRKVIPSTYRATLSELLGKRHTADYGPGTMSRRQAERASLLASGFVHAVLGSLPGAA